MLVLAVRGFLDDSLYSAKDLLLWNRADQSMYTAERMLKDTGDKIAIADKNAIENAMAELKKAIESNDAAAMSKSMDELLQAQHKASEALYKQQGAFEARRVGGAMVAACHCTWPR